MNINDTDIIIIDTIDAYQIEDGDQIIVDDEPLENVTVQDDPEDNDGIIVTGFSWETGDKVVHTLPFDYHVQMWAV